MKTPRNPELDVPEPVDPSTQIKVSLDAVHAMIIIQAGGTPVAIDIPGALILAHRLLGMANQIVLNGPSAPPEDDQNPGDGGGNTGPKLLLPDDVG